MEHFGFNLYVTDGNTEKVGRVVGVGNRSREIIREKEEKDKQRIIRKAIREHKTIKQIEEEEAKKRIERYEKAKYKRYLKEIEELKSELEYKTNWVKRYEEKA